ncbi:MAG: hypothetical protein DDT27_01523 [Dehalococcoidia bacterium]|nr:hypothetical protein [Chloroflexota bacterium]
MVRRIRCKRGVVVLMTIPSAGEARQARMSPLFSSTMHMRQAPKVDNSEW